LVLSDLEVRARRRGILAADLKVRDEKDRATGQLLPRDIDAVALDNSAAELSQTVSEIEAIVRMRLSA
jgi:cytidylate kinase